MQDAGCRPQDKRRAMDDKRQTTNDKRRTTDGASVRLHVLAASPPRRLAASSPRLVTSSPRHLLASIVLLLLLPVMALWCVLDLPVSPASPVVWAAPPVAPLVQEAPLVREFTLGMSAQGRPITVVQIGAGARKLVVVGDTHGGAEANTYQLTLQLVEYFRANPEQVPPGVRLYLIPTINPDGLALGHRFDAWGVDLNRNMNTNLDNCPENDWSTTVFGAYGVISDTGGPYPDSQVESRLIRSFLLDASGAIFLHSNAGLVFPAYCEHPPSIEMAQVYAGAANYLYNRYWINYMITGSMADWAGSLGIAAITPELLSGEASEYPQNLAGLQAVLAQAETLLPLPADRVVNEQPVPALIWRYWQSHGGAAVFGLPLEPAQPTAQGMAQTFTRARIELDESQADTPFLLRPALLGTARARMLGSELPGSIPCADGSGPCPLSTDILFGAFLDYWQRNGGLDVFGFPLSQEFDTIAADGQWRTVQYFERAVFAYYPEDGSVRPEPLGWLQAQVEGVTADWLTPQVR